MSQFARQQGSNGGTQNLGADNLMKQPVVIIFPIDTMYIYLLAAPSGTHRLF